MTGVAGGRLPGADGERRDAAGTRPGADRDRPRVAVVGGGLAGLMTAIQVCELGGRVDLFSLLPAKRSHSVAAQGGINGAEDRGEGGDSPWEHFDDTVYGGDFLANQPPVLAMCRKAPAIIDLLDRVGVMFNRTPEGRIDRRRFGGAKRKRTAFAGATTGQQVLYALDDQARRWEVEGRLRRLEGWDFLAPALDGSGTCVGLAAQHMSDMAIEAFPADAVVMATGGLGMVFGRSTNSVLNTGAAAAACLRAGALWANGEFIQVHPTAVPGPDKMRLMSESIRGEGGRLWVPRNGRPWYFLEEWYPEYGNLVPRDVATRAIHRVVVEMGLGIDGERAVYLDVRHLPRDVLDRKLGGVMELYEKYVGVDPREHPMKVYPAVHYSMGGLWVDPERDMTSIPGLFAAGECNYQYHGANRLGANSLLSCLYDGFVAGPAAFAWAEERAARRARRRRASPDGMSGAARDGAAGRDGAAAGDGMSGEARDGAAAGDGLPGGSRAAARDGAALQRTLEECRRAFDALLAMDGPENPYDLHRELGEMMTDHVTVVRENGRLREVMARLAELAGRWERAGLRDHGLWANQDAQFLRHLRLMIDIAKVITKGALLRDESRGAHHKPAFPDRDDERWLRTTIARWGGPGAADEPLISYEPVDTSLIAPRPRRYDRPSAADRARPPADARERGAEAGARARADFTT